MRFQVPQFIEVEDKIFGPLTFKQFIYLAGGAGICVLLLILFPKFLALLLCAPVAAFSGALAFYKFNDKPFINLVESFINYSFTHKLYIWKKVDKIIDNKQNAINNGPIRQIQIPKLSESKLRDLTWSLDIKENANPVTQDNER